MSDAFVQLRQITWEPALAPWLIALLASAAVLGVSASLRSAPATSRFGLRALRFAAILGIATLLLNPRLPIPAAPEQRASLAILIDTSESMGVADGPGPGSSDSRLATLRTHWLNPLALARLNRAADVQLLAFADGAATISQGEIASLPSIGTATRVAAAVEAAIAAHRPAVTGATALGAAAQRVLVISDAVDTTGADIASLAPLATARGVRIDFAMPNVRGASTPPADVAVAATPRKALIAASESATIDIAIEQQGFEGQAATLTLREVSPVDRILATRKITLGGDLKISLDVTPALAAGAPRGLHSIECVASIEHLAAERDTDNNTDPFFLQVSDDRVRVAMFEGAPSWDSRAFVAALADDPRFEVTIVHALGRRASGAESSEALRTRRITPGVATTTEETGLGPSLSQEELNAFDVIVLGRRIEAIFPGELASRLTRYVTEHSGTLVLLRGNPVSDAGEAAGHGARQSMERLLPLAFEGSTAPSTQLFGLPAGVRALGAVAAALDEAPDVDAIARVRDLSPLVSTWLAGFDLERSQTIPAMISAPVGGGRVLVNLADGLWRWGMLPPDRAAWRRALAAFWPQIMLTLALGAEWAPGQDVSLAVDRVVANVGEPVTVVVRARGPLAGVLNPTVQIRESKSHSEASLSLTPAADQPGMWTGVVSASTPGVLAVALPAAHATDPKLLAQVQIRRGLDEIRNLRPDRERAVRLAHVTGGEVFSAEEAERYIALIESDAIAGRAETVSAPIWRRGGVFWFVAGVLALEWFWRRRIGLS